MGHVGKLSRGLKWWLSNRDLDGVLKPTITQDTDKMLDVNYYLDYVKDKDKEDVNLVLFQMAELHYAPGGKKSQLFKDLKKRVDSGDFPVKKVIQKTNSKEDKEKK